MSVHTRPRRRHRPPRLFYDIKPAVASVRAATSFGQVTAAMAGVGTAYGFTFSHASATNPEYTALRPGDLPVVKVIAQQVLEGLAMYPPTAVRDRTRLATFVFVFEITAVSGAIAYVLDGREMVICAEYGDRPGVDAYYTEVFHHELQHVWDAHFEPAVTAMANRWYANNPSGWIYGTAMNTNLVPVDSFVSHYAGSHYYEDRAEVHCYLMTRQFYWWTNRRIVRDAGMRGKVGLMREFHSVTTQLGASLYALAAGDTS